MANVKLGNNTLTGVTTVRLQNADAAGEYVSFNDLVAQEKTAAVTTNGTTEVTPDSRKTLSKVTITTNVPKAADASDRLDTLLRKKTKKVDSLPTSVPTSLPNPHPLIINGQIYDGSKEVTMTIDGITFDDIEAQDWLLKCGDSAGKENSITN